MGIYHDAYLEMIEKEGHRAVLEFLIDKMEEAGHKATEEAKENILSNLKNKIYKFEFGEDISISFDEKDYQLLEERLSGVSDKLFGADFLIKNSARAAADILESSFETWDVYAAERDLHTKDFIEELHECWKEPIKYLQMLKEVFYEAGEEAVIDAGKLISQGELQDSPSLSLSVRLHARGCQLFDEIIALIRCGYAEGAMARWRTFHELNVVAHFIFERDDKLANKYMFHDAIESHKAARNHQECFEALGYDPIPDEEFSEIKRNAEELVARFGKNYRSSYGWAADDLKKSNPTFQDIAKAVKLDHFKTYYRLASHGVHANAKGLLFRMSQPDNTELLIAGPSVYGLTNPISCAATTATQFFAALNTQWGLVDSLIAVKVIMILLEKVNLSLELVNIDDDEFSDPSSPTTT